MVGLASRGAVRDQQNQRKEAGGQNAGQDKRDPEEDPPDRFQRVATGVSLRRLDVDDEAGRIAQLEGADARPLG